MILNQCILYATGLCFTFAYDDLSFKANASQSPLVLDLRNEYEANRALDRNKATCMRTADIGTRALHKTTWWKVDLGGVYSIYDINIVFKNYEQFENRQRGRFAGFSLYVSISGNINNSTLCYKDGPQLPPLNFTKTCVEYGRYVIFYNERKDEVGYPEGYQYYTMNTELCEVIVKGCKNPHVFGTECNISCPVTCKYKTCHIQTGACLDCDSGVYGSYCNLSCPANCKHNTCSTPNGTCFSCKPGFRGLYCRTKCADGWHGVNCSQQCVGHCKDGAVCNHVTGGCGKGCDAGWTGNTCESQCKNGTYGNDCTNKCNGHCLNDSPCNKQTGNCDRGCSPGYTDSDCSKECPPYYFGVNCNNECSGHCDKNLPCDHVSGLCHSGCQDGYMDKFFVEYSMHSWKLWKALFFAMSSKMQHDM
ncbi:multiple epidermal growth factor-like domains protein 6 [Crassostrea angulata]|uniref:multiple epidermal growth factor-like domains protein 6 n=1 Tax=Magallana angulata TaxID=2784310 RepID=UPI0022B134A3|nr:multiple epidermal growth factor-like domains protein 6 [Crassostrea angulata]